MNLLFCSVGRRGELIKFFRKSLEESSRIIAADNSITAPALYFADKQYIVPKITEENYIPVLLDICRREQINAITTFIDPEIEILAKNRCHFENMGIEVLVPNYETAKLCFDKFAMYEFFTENNIKTVKTFKNIKTFTKSFQKGDCDFPVFVKPRAGSGSVGARKINSFNDLLLAFSETPDLIIQEYVDGADLDVDVYIDTISHKPVSIFSKKKLETKIGGANKTISFKDKTLFDLVEKIVSFLDFNGPIDIDFFYENGEYLVSEINPRFGGAYLHAYCCGVDFIKLIMNNLNGIENKKNIGEYEENIIMMMYDSVVIKRESELKGILR